MGRLNLFKALEELHVYKQKQAPRLAVADMHSTHNNEDYPLFIACVLMLNGWSQ